jgi:hypothetical protein
MMRKRTLKTERQAPQAGSRRRWTPSRVYARGIALSLLFLGLLGAGTTGQDLPPDVQYSFMTKILTYDRALKARAGDTITVGIVYQSNFAASRSTKDELVLAIEKSPVERIRGLPIAYVTIDASRGRLSADELARLGVTVLYVTPLSGIETESIAEICRASRVPSMTGVSEQVDAGVAVGILHDGSNRVFRVNLSEAKRQGADFSSQFLKLARIER